MKTTDGSLKEVAATTMTLEQVAKWGDILLKKILACEVTWEHRRYYTSGTERLAHGRLRRVVVIDGKLASEHRVRLSGTFEGNYDMQRTSSIWLSSLEVRIKSDMSEFGHIYQEQDIPGYVSANLLIVTDA